MFHVQGKALCFIFSTCKKTQQGSDDEEHNMNAAFEANAYHTYQVNAIGYHVLNKSTEVLLDNQANISIMKLSLLCNLEKAESEDRTSGVRGRQRTVRKTGYLEDFFHVYSKRTVLRRCLRCVRDYVYPEEQFYGTLTLSIKENCM
jgi:hypothetical protein